MPDGITRLLTHAELVDLVRFISELGKPGPYALPTTATVQRWKRLRTVPVELASAVPNEDVFRDRVLAAAADAWDTVYTRFNGQLPLAELPKAARSVVYLRGEVQVAQAGPIDVHVDLPVPATLWVDDQQHDKPGKVTVNLPTGRHTLTIRLEVPATVGASALRVELGKPADSAARFDVLNGGD
jgi:hypothetical protein